MTHRNCDCSSTVIPTHDLPNNLTEKQKQLIDPTNYKGSSDEADDNDEEAAGEERNKRDALDQEDDEIAFATIQDPLNHRLSSKRRRSLKALLKPDKNHIPCPWCPSIHIYDWIVIVIGMFELQFNFFEEHVVELQHNKTFQEMKGQCKAKFTGEIKNCAIACFSAAVQGYSNAMLMRGSGGVTVLNNENFFQRYEKIDNNWSGDNWIKTIINPLARWIDDSFRSQAIMQLYTTVSAPRNSRKRNSKGASVPVAACPSVRSHNNSWFTANDLLNGRGGGTTLAYFAKRFSLVTDTCDSTTKITDSKCVFFVTGLVLQRIGIVTDKWQLKTDNLLPTEIKIYNDNKKLAWTSRERVERFLNRYKLERAQRIHAWQISKLQNTEIPKT